MPHLDRVLLQDKSPIHYPILLTGRLHPAHRLGPAIIVARAPTAAHPHITVLTQTILVLILTLLACTRVTILVAPLALSFAALGVVAHAGVILDLAGVLAGFANLVAAVGLALGGVLGRVALEGVGVEAALLIVARYNRGTDAADALAVGVAGIGRAAWENADVGCSGRADGGGCGGGVTGGGWSADASGSRGGSLGWILGIAVALAAFAGPCATVRAEILTPLRVVHALREI